MNTDLLESRNQAVFDRCQAAYDAREAPEFYLSDDDQGFTDETIACFARAFGNPSEDAHEFLTDCGIADVPSPDVCDVMQKLAELQYRRPAGYFPSDLYETFDAVMEKWARVDYDKRMKEEE